MYHYIHKHIYIYIDIYIRRLALLMGNIYDWLSLTLRSLYVSECFWSFIWFYVEVLSGLAANHSLLNHVISNPILLYTWCPANVSVSKFGSPTTRTSWILKLLKNTHVYDFEVCYGCPMRVFFSNVFPFKTSPFPWTYRRRSLDRLLARNLREGVANRRLGALGVTMWRPTCSNSPWYQWFVLLSESHVIWKPFPWIIGSSFQACVVFGHWRANKVTKSTAKLDPKLILPCLNDTVDFTA